MMANGVETYFEDGQWKYRIQGNQRASATFDTKIRAQAAARDRARRDHLEHFIKRKDGTIQERNSYGKDPFPPKG